MMEVLLAVVEIAAHGFRTGIPIIGMNKISLSINRMFKYPPSMMKSRSAALVAAEREEWTNPNENPTNLYSLEGMTFAVSMFVSRKVFVLLEVTEATMSVAACPFGVAKNDVVEAGVVAIFTRSYNGCPLCYSYYINILVWIRYF